MQHKTLTRSNNSMLFGVCAGLAEFIGWGAGKVRIIWVLLTIFSCGGLVIAYIICAFIFPKPTRGELLASQGSNNSGNNHPRP